VCGVLWAGSRRIFLCGVLARARKGFSSPRHRSRSIHQIQMSKDDCNARRTGARFQTT